MLRSLFYQLLHYSPLHWVWKAPDDQLRVLAYHDIQDKEGFRWQLDYLQKYYHIISGATLEKHLSEGTPLPPRSVLITFDDAYPNVYHRAYPLLESAGIPAILFVITSLPNTDQPFWWDEVLYYTPAIWTKKEKHLKLLKVKSWPNTKRVNWLIDIKTKSKLTPLTRKHLKWEQLKEMDEKGITIANHTHRHPILDKCDEATITDEITTANTILGQQKVNGQNYFAYPNGNASATAESFLQKSGYRLVFLFDHQVNAKQLNPLRISRLSVNATTPAALFKFILSGGHSKLLNLRKRWR